MKAAIEQLAAGVGGFKASDPDLKLAVSERLTV